MGPRGSRFSGRGYDPIFFRAPLLYESLGRAVFAGEQRLVAGVASSAAAGGGDSGKAPQPLPFGGVVPAGAGSSGGLGASSSGVGGAGLAVLALFLFLFRAGGSLMWLSFEIPKLNSAPVAINERPG